jgi:hypothetical protein
MYAQPQGKILWEQVFCELARCTIYYLYQEGHFDHQIVQVAKH